MPLIFNSRLIVPAVLALLLLAADASGQRRGDNDWFPLGGIEAQGIPISLDGKKAAVEVKLVHPKGFADKGKLQVGDRIVAANGKKLKGKGDAVIDAFCAQIMKSEEKKARGKTTGILKVDVMRGDKKVALQIPVAPLGKFKGNDPKKCPRTKAVLADAMKFLKKSQSGEGHFTDVISNQNQMTVGAVLSGLAFLGAGNKYKKNYLKSLEYVKRHVLDSDTSNRGGANWNQSNWSLGYGALLLSESVAQKKNGATKKLLRKVVKQIEANQEASGGWAHGPGGPNALNYLELQIMSNFCMAGLGMAQGVGIELDTAKVVKAVEFVKTCTTGGGVAYSPRPGQAGHGEAGRTAGAYWAHRLLGRQGKSVNSMWKFYDNNLDKLPEGHVSPCMHILAGGLASAVRGKKAYQKFWSVYRDYIMSCRDSDGAFNARPTDESRSLRSNSDREHGRAFITAHYALLMLLAQDNFKLLDVEASRP